MAPSAAIFDSGDQVAAGMVGGILPGWGYGPDEPATDAYNRRWQQSAIWVWDRQGHGDLLRSELPELKEAAAEVDDLSG